MLSALLALAGAAIYGGSDFFGGMAARGMSAVRVTLASSITGLAVLLVVLVVVPSRWSVAAIVTGSIAGVAGAIALLFLYRCLAVGPMSILAPLMALISATVPIAIGLARGERLSVAGYAGIAVGLVAVLLICLVPGSQRARPRASVLAMAVGAGLAVGAYLVIIDLSPSDSGPAPLVMTFVSTTIVMAGILAVQRARRGSPALNGGSRSSWRYAIICGLTDGVAAFLFLLALRTGDLSVVAVFNALAPAGTIVLAAIVLRERIAPVQWLGLIIALVAAALLALA